MGRRRTRPEEDVEIGATASPEEDVEIGAFGATSDVFDVAAIGEVVGAREEDEVLRIEFECTGAQSTQVVPALQRAKQLNFMLSQLKAVMDA